MLQYCWMLFYFFFLELFCMFKYCQGLLSVLVQVIFFHIGFFKKGASLHYIHQMAFCVLNCDNVLPNDISTEYPGYACLLGKFLETAGVSLSHPNCLFETVGNCFKLWLDRDLLFNFFGTSLRMKVVENFVSMLSFYIYLNYCPLKDWIQSRKTY